MSVSDINTTAWCQPPHVSAAGRESVRRLQHAIGFNPVCVENEETLAAWLWLLVSEGLLFASEVEAALSNGVEWHRLLKLSERGGERLIDALAATAAKGVPEDIAAMDWNWWLGVHVPLDANPETQQIKIVAHAALDVRIDFLALPVELASALCEAFRLLQSLLPMDLGLELFQRFWMAADRIADYEGLRDRGLLDKPEAALAFLQNKGNFDMFDPELEDVAPILANAPNWLERERYWPDERHSGTVNERADFLLEQTAKWREGDHPLRGSAWRPFIECVASYVQHRGDLPELFYQHDAVLSIEEMEIDLSVACCVLSTNGVEEMLLGDCREMIAEASESAVVSLALDASNRDAVWPLLKDMATASGLLMWAQELAAVSGEAGE